MAKIYGALEVAQLEWFTDAGKPAASVYQYRVIYISDTNQVVVSDGTNWNPVNARFTSAVNSSATGTSAAISPSTNNLIAVTNSSLSSIGSIATPAPGLICVLVNETGNSVQILDEDLVTGTAANRIRTGTGAPITVANNSAVYLIYVSNDSRWHVVGGVGSGSQAVGSFISNGQAEADTTGWATYADAAGASPVDGTGGSPTVTWTRTTTNPLIGTASFLFTKGASNSQGQGASFDFIVDSAYRSKLLQISFEYAVASGTFAAGTSSVDSDITVWIYDRTNNVLIQPTVYKLFSNSALSTSFVGNFQTAGNSTSYRLILHVGTTSASAFTMLFDNVVVSSIPATQPAAVIPFTVQRFTSGSGTYTTPPNVKYLKVRMVGGGGGGGGASANAVGSTAGGTGGTSTFGSSFLTANGGNGGASSAGATGGTGGGATIVSPAISVFSMNGASGQTTGAYSAGVSISISGGTGGTSVFGGAGAGGGWSTGAPAAGQAGVTNSGSGGGGGAVITSNNAFGGHGGGAGGYIEAVILNPAATYSYSVGAGGTAGGAAGANASVGGAGGSGVIIVEEHYDTSPAVTNVDYDKAEIGTIHAFAGTTAPTGFLFCDGSAVSRTQYSDLFTVIGTSFGVGDGSTTFNLPNTRGIFLRGAGTNPDNASNTATFAARQLDDLKSHTHSYIFPNTLSNVGAGGGAQVGQAAGNTGATGGTETRPANLGVNYIIRFAKRVIATVAASSDTVAMRYTDSSGGAIGTSLAVYRFQTRDFDSHLQYSTSTGLYTVPISGKYQIAAAMQTSAISFSAAQAVYFYIYKNGSQYGVLGQTVGNGTANTWILSGSDTVQCNAGDTLAIYIGATVATTANPVSTANHLSIVRVGN